MCRAVSVAPCLSGWVDKYHQWAEAENLMRELFDEVAGKSPLDPEEAVRRTTRGTRRTRFYTKADFAETADGFAITLDDKTVRTPSGRSLMAPTPEIAEVIASEWGAQQEFIDPVTMPMTRFANSVVDAVVDRVEAVADDIAKYLGTDLLFYRAAHPEALVAREAAQWDPVLYWAANDLGAHFILAEGIVHVRQPDSAIAAARAALPVDPWQIAALHVVTTLTGSALLALALNHGALDADQVWTAAHVDEDWNSEKWGVDAEVASRRAFRLVDFRAAAAIITALTPRA
jgi:chaperone required for assembly of F1-ATPase